MKQFPEEFYLVMSITRKVTGNRPLMTIGYKKKYRNVLGLVATRGYGTSYPGDTYLSRLPEAYSNVYI